MEWRLGAEFWSGVLVWSVINFWVENTLVLLLFIKRYNRTCVKVTNERLIGLAYQIYSGVLEWSQILEWQMFFALFIKIQQDIWKHPKSVTRSKPQCCFAVSSDKTGHFCQSKIWLHSNTPLQNSAPRRHSIEYTVLNKTLFKLSFPDALTEMVPVLKKLKSLDTQSVILYVYIVAKGAGTMFHINCLFFLRSVYDKPSEEILKIALSINGPSKVKQVQSNVPLKR